MHKHEYWDRVLMHDDDELTQHIGSTIAERVTIHEWPLSCVQRITTADGSKLIYKAQGGANACSEPDFYAGARSSLLPKAETLYRNNENSCMLLEFIDGQRLADMKPKEEDALAVAREILDQIGEIEGDFPFRCVAAGEEGWKKQVDSILQDLAALVEQGKYTHVNPEVMRTLERCALSPSVLESLSVNVGLCHGDFSVTNILVGKDGYKVIDWHPTWGWRDLDLANLLSGISIDPAKHVNRGILAIGRVMVIEYLIYCTKTGIRSAAGNDPDTVMYVAEMERLLVGRSGSR